MPLGKNVIFKIEIPEIIKFFEVKLRFLNPSKWLNVSTFQNNNSVTFFCSSSFAFYVMFCVATSLNLKSSKLLMMKQLSDYFTANPYVCRFSSS